jgi:quercetin dioxygenase-like cupin family protein
MARQRCPRDSLTIVAARETRTMNTSGKTRVVALAAIILGALAGPVLAQAKSDKEIFINPKDIKWGDAPPSIPKGAKLAVLQGDPGKTGPFVIRLMLPPGFKLPPHAHSQDESLTVISGTFYFGTGDKIEMSKAHALNAGGFHALSAGDHHYAFAKAQTVVQVNGMGPFNITYINPDDDPQTAKK